MKPISIRFECFGPYMEPQTVDLEGLAQQGIFLICGETGAGKTTILDAMCCALYGKCSGDTRGEMLRMRCKLAGPEDATAVEFVFENDGRRYRFMRRLAQKRSRRPDAKPEYNEFYECARLQEGTWVPLLDNPKKKNMNEEAERIVGLTFDQFRQVIILPQGRFETLLTSSSEDKEAILVSLFHAEKWEKALRRMAEDTERRDREVRRLREGIGAALGRLGIPDAGQLPFALEEARRQAQAGKEASAQAEKQRQAAQQALDAAQRTEAAFSELDRLALRLRQGGGGGGAGGGELQGRLQAAEQAEKARLPHEQWLRACTDLDAEIQSLSKTEKELEKAGKDLQRAETAKSAHAERAGERQAWLEESLRLKDLRERYVRIDGLQRDADAAEALWRRACGNAEKAADLAEKQKEGLQRASDLWEEKTKAYQDISRAYRAAGAGILARELTEGSPCPVCGSLHHPSPAAPAAEGLDSNDVERAEGRMAAAREAYKKQRDAADAAEAALQKAAYEQAAARSALDTAATVLKGELAGRVPGLDSLEALGRRERELARMTEAYDDQARRCDQEAQQAAVRCSALAEQCRISREKTEKCRQERAGKEAAWLEALAAAGIRDETAFRAGLMDAAGQQQLRRTLAGHAAGLNAARQALEEQRKRTEGLQRPDIQAAKQLFAGADEAYKAAVQQAAAFRLRYEMLTEEAGNLARDSAELEGKSARLDADRQFMEALRASTGISLQRYVLGVRLSQVTAEANRLLSTVYGGRFRLQRSDESSGSVRKKGLELEVYDSMNDQTRSAGTLSGGEKFLVALSLAIGLSTVVQNEQRGVALEAMFIDEGFGSLDQNALGDALDILQSVRRGHGLVGIISHVERLRETVGAKLTVRKTARGSVIE